MPEIDPAFDNPLHYKQIRAEIGGVFHSVVNCEITGGLSNGPTVGGVEARQIDLDIIPAGTINDDDAVTISVRLVEPPDVTNPGSARQSDWIPKGTFFIDSNPIDSATGVMSIHGFDAMMKTEQPMLQDGESKETWPKTPLQVMNRVCAAIGVTLDPRTNLNAAYLIPYPTENSTRENQDDSGEDSPKWILNTNTKLIHRPACSRVAQIDSANYGESNLTVAELEINGYTPCSICNPSDDDSGDDSASLSMRTVASYIAAMNGGNWTITDQNQLYLVPVEVFNSTIRLLSADTSRAILFGNVLIVI